VRCGNVPVKNNANRFLFQKATYRYPYPIPLVKSSYALKPEKKCNYNLYFPKYKITASRSRQPMIPHYGGLAIENERFMKLREISNFVNVLRAGRAHGSVEAARRKTRETRGAPLPFGVLSHTCGHFRVSHVSFDGLKEKRDCSLARVAGA